MSQPTSKEINPRVKADDHGDAGESLRYASDPTPEKAAELPTIELSEPNPNDSFEGRSEQSLRLAEEAFAKTGSWVMFFREILGVDGVVRQLFPDPKEFRRFIRGPEFATLHEMLAAIRSQDQSKSDAAEPERMITIRIPRSLHEALQKESEACGLSINKLSISKLLWPADSRFVPEQQGRRRGRRPGPQGKRAGNSNHSHSANSNSEHVPASGQESGSANPTTHPETPRMIAERSSLHRWSDSNRGGSISRG